MRTRFLRARMVNLDPDHSVRLRGSVHHVGKKEDEPMTDDRREDIGELKSPKRGKEG